MVNVGSIVIGESHPAYSTTVALVLQHPKKVFRLRAVHSPPSAVVIARLASARAIRLDEGVLVIEGVPLRAVSLVSVPESYRVDRRKPLTRPVPVDPADLADLLPRQGMGTAAGGTPLRVEVRRLRKPRVPVVTDVAPLDRPHSLFSRLCLHCRVGHYDDQVFRKDTCLTVASILNMLSLDVVPEFLHEPAADVHQLPAICHVEAGIPRGISSARPQMAAIGRGDGAVGYHLQCQDLRPLLLSSAIPTHAAITGLAEAFAMDLPAIPLATQHLHSLRHTHYPETVVPPYGTHINGSSPLPVLRSLPSRTWSMAAISLMYGRSSQDPNTGPARTCVATPQPEFRWNHKAPRGAVAPHVFGPDSV